VLIYLKKNVAASIITKQLAEQFNKAGERCKQATIQFCYHNHDFEFKEQNGPITVSCFTGEHR
jgi:hypothetical protein